MLRVSGGRRDSLGSGAEGATLTVTAAQRVIGSRDRQSMTLRRIAERIG